MLGWSSGWRRRASTAEREKFIELRPAITTPFDELQAVDVPCDRPGGPRERQGGVHRCRMPLEPIGTVPQLPLCKGEKARRIIFCSTEPSSHETSIPQASQTIRWCACQPWTCPYRHVVQVEVRPDAAARKVEHKPLAAWRAASGL